MLSFIKLALVMVSVHSSKTLTKTEVGTRDWGIVLGLTMLLFERMWICRTLDLENYGLL